MDGVGHELLARSGLGEEEHGKVRGGEACRATARLHEDGIVACDAREGGLAAGRGRAAGERSRRAVAIARERLQRGVLAQRGLDRGGDALHDDSEEWVGAAHRTADVEDARDAAIGIVDRRGVADEPVCPRVIVGAADDHDRGSLRERRADAVGAALRLAPALTRDEPFAHERVVEHVDTERLEDDAVLVGEEEGEAATS